jgi:hypothetical protein
MEVYSSAIRISSSPQVSAPPLVISSPMEDLSSPIRDPNALLERMYTEAKAPNDVVAPMASGVYAWFLDHPAALPTISSHSGSPIYVGLSSNLHERGDETHFRDGSTGFSTLRRSLGALLKSELDLQAEPRGTGASRQNYQCYRFDDAGEVRLTSWMLQHLRVGVAEHPAPDTIETALIVVGEPPLNLTKWANPHRATIKALRSECVAEARRNHPRQ